LVEGNTETLMNTREDGMMNATTLHRGLKTVTLVALLPLAACYEHTINVGGGARPQAPVVYDHWQNFWLGGLIGHTKVDMEEMCPSGPATMEAKQTFLNGLVAALTSGIYTPTTVRVRCDDGRNRDLELDGEDVAAMVAHPDFLLWVGADMPDRLDEVVAAQSALADR
jgi:hypothetical protein